MSSDPEQDSVITRREAIRRVSAALGGVAFVGGSSLLAACEKQQERAQGTAAGASVGTFSGQEVAFLDEVADTMLPETKTPGAKAAKVGAFMALMVTDSYSPADQKTFRDGMRALDDASRKASNAPFMSATPQQRLALLERLDREQKSYTDAREAARTSARAKPAGGAAAGGDKKAADTSAVAKTGGATRADAHLPDARQENAPNAEVGAGGAAAISADSPAHYFRMMKELALLGYFTSEIGYTKAMRYVESPGRFDPCVPYKPGDRAWAPHA